MSARRWETAWKVPIGRPNCSRLPTYSTQVSRTRCQRPIWPAAMNPRSYSIVEVNTW